MVDRCPSTPTLPFLFLTFLRQAEKRQIAFKKRVSHKKKLVKQSGSIQSIQSTVEEDFFFLFQALVKLPLCCRCTFFFFFFLVEQQLPELWNALCLFSHYSGDYGNVFGFLFVPYIRPAQALVCVWKRVWEVNTVEPSEIMSQITSPGLVCGISDTGKHIFNTNWDFAS